MSKPDSFDELLDSAFRLAYFIHADRHTALRLAFDAAAKLEVASVAQTKRLYYVPGKQQSPKGGAGSGARTKVFLSDRHLLQRLVYIESEKFERALEVRAGGVDEAQMLVHFVKHLVRVTTKRSSFYVALGVSRLLHNYSTTETMEIYNVVVQDPERVKDDYYYRSRKSRLLQEVKERFDDFVNVYRGVRGEERFQTLDSPDEFVELVLECLRQFSPWHTPCLIPPRYDPTADEIPTLSSAHQSEEDKVEINRMHAVVHPDCYELLTSSLKLESPALRLSVPRFNLPNGKNDMSGPNNKPRRAAPPLDTSEVEALKRILNEQSARRKATHASLLSIVVDRVERARLDLDASGSVSFAVSDSDELVEVRALDDDGTLLATHFLGGVESSDSISTTQSEIVLEGGQKLTFKLSSEQGDASEDSRAFLSVSYQETEWRSSAALFRRRMARRINTSVHAKRRRNKAVFKPAFAVLLLLICVGALALYVLRGARKPEPTQLAAHNQQPPAELEGRDSAITNSNAPASNSNKSPEIIPGSQTATQNAPGAHREKKPSRNETAQAVNSAQTIRPNTRPRPSTPEQTQVALSRTNHDTGSNAATEIVQRNSDATRSVESNAAATALSKVRKVFIEVTGERGLSEQTSRLLASSLRDGQRLTPTDVEDEADAAFKIKVSGRAPTGATHGDKGDKASRVSDPEKRFVTVSVRLVNEDGEVIWPSNSKGKGGVYTGTVRDVTSRIAGDLLKDILKSDAQK